jgi:hypothetical protein
MVSKLESVDATIRNIHIFGLEMVSDL